MGFVDAAGVTVDCMMAHGRRTAGLRLKCSSSEEDGSLTSGDDCSYCCD